MASKIFSMLKILLQAVRGRVWCVGAVSDSSLPLPAFSSPRSLGTPADRAAPSRSLGGVLNAHLLLTSLMTCTQCLYCLCFWGATLLNWTERHRYFLNRMMSWDFVTYVQGLTLYLAGNLLISKYKECN